MNTFQDDMRDLAKRQPVLKDEMFLLDMANHIDEAQK